MGRKGKAYFVEEEKGKTPTEVGQTAHAKELSGGCQRGGALATAPWSHPEP